jgi:teichuronic acid biosynthesis glycosyltransferase TuaG
MISILMPIYNGIEFIDESVISVLSQTMQEWELIIGINGHEPNSQIYQLAKSYETLSSKIHVYDLYEMKGKPNSLNEMMKYVKYAHVAILDVDDIWNQHKLEKQMPYVMQNYDVVGSRCIYFGENTHMNGIVPWIPTGDISDFDFFQVNPVINSSAIIKREYAKWDNSFVEDYDLWLSLRRQGKRFFNYQEILVKHRIHDQSAFNSKGNSNHVPDLLEKHK